MKMSFWSQSQGLVRRLQPGPVVQRRRARCRPLQAETLEARTFLSSTPTMVADIAPGAPSSGPSQMVAIGSTTYFVANDGVRGNELWKTDGTAAGTSMVKDIWPGGRSSYIANLTDLNGTLFFVANDGVHAEQLWKSDGTAAGTLMITDVNVGLSTNPGTLTSVNGTLFFAANNGLNGNELWKSDGTAAGTTMVDNISPGGITDSYGYYEVNSSNPSNLTNVNGTLFFTADVAPNDPALFKSDGTAAGTVMLTPAGSIPSNLTNVNGTLFFAAAGTGGDELWKSDGTVAGTAMVKDIYPGGTTYSGYYGSSYVFNSSSPRNLTNVNGTLFFIANDGTDGTELWESDGTDAGTVLVADINPGSASSYLGNLTNVSGTLFFSARDGTHGQELWKSDGTTTGTVMVKDINPGSGSYPSWLTNVNGTLFFQASDRTHGEELWKSDGTAGGTVMVADINPGSASSIPANLTDANGTLFFSANDGIHGNELWAIQAGSPATLTWDGAPSGQWTDSQWIGAGAPYPNSSVNSIVDTSSVVQVNSSQAANGLAISSGGNVAVVSGGSLGIVGDTSVTAAGQLSIDPNGSFATGGTLLVDSGGTVAGGVVSANAYQLNDGTVSANLAGPGGLTKDTSGTVTLAGMNTYAGPTTVDTGTLVIEPGALPNGTSLIIGGTATAPATVILAPSDATTVILAPSDASGNPLVAAASSTQAALESGATATVESGTAEQVAARSTVPTATNPTSASNRSALDSRFGQIVHATAAALPLGESPSTTKALSPNRAARRFATNLTTLPRAELPLSQLAHNAAVVDVIFAADGKSSPPSRSEMMASTAPGLASDADFSIYLGGAGRAIVDPSPANELFWKIGF